MEIPRKIKKEKVIQFCLIILTVIMIVIRFLLNEKGRVSPDSIRFLRFANVFPEIDNTTTPIGYPVFIKLFTVFGLDEFWSSKVVGLLSYTFIIWFAWKKKFYFRETILIGGLFSFVSLFAATLSEAFTLPFVFIFIYFSSQTINGKYSLWKAVFLLSTSLIVIYNIRYSGMFFMGSCILFGLYSYRKNYGKIFITSGCIGFVFIVLYKFLFIDTFNKNYIDEALEVGYYSTSKLIPELLKGLAVSSNPFIHIANPGGGFINIGIYGIGALVIFIFFYLIFKKVNSAVDQFLICIGICGIVCSFFIQYFYVIDPLDYRLLCMFLFPLWLIFFRRIYYFVGNKVYAVTFLSLITGFIFTWMSKGNYLENRKQVQAYLQNNQLSEKPIKFFANSYNDGDALQLAELFSTVNSNLTVTFKTQDTLSDKTLTKYKILRKIKIDKNNYQ